MCEYHKITDIRAASFLKFKNIIKKAYFYLYAQWELEIVASLCTPMTIIFTISVKGGQ